MAEAKWWRKAAFFAGIVHDIKASATIADWA
jgi:hypothetical protein